MTKVNSQYLQICVVYDGNGIILVRSKTSWPGITFPKYGRSKSFVESGTEV